MANLKINREYPCNRANYQGKRTQPIKYLVIHYVGALGGARANAIHYHNNTPQISAHYFVGHADEGAAIYASVAEDCIASHCGRTDGLYWHPECRNANSIGIEMCCHQDGGGRWYFDPETVDQTVELGRDIMARYGIPIDHVLRHYDVTGKICPAPFVNDPEAWAALKQRLEEPEMTKAEVQTALETFYEEKNPLYLALDQVPDYWRAEAKALMDAGAVKGDGVHPISIRKDTLQALIAAKRYADSLE